LLVSFVANGAEWHLNAAATGSNNGTSQANGWVNTTNIVWSSVGSGDTLWVHQGSYEGLHISEKSGITVRIATNATAQAVFSGSVNSQLYNVDDSTIDGLLNGNQLFRFAHTNGVATVDGTIFRLRLCQNVILRGLEISRPDYYNDDTAELAGIALNNSSAPANDFITIEDCHIHHITSDGINCKRISTGATILDDSNIYWDTPGVQFYGTGGSPEGIPGDRQAGASRYIDPMLVNIPAHNFRPLTGSPAIGTGVALTDFFTTDILGSTRVGAWDVGPYAYRPLRFLNANTLNVGSINKTP
jgi:hypothetical protein